jgi:diguanylate cyclase (GGDEF)-like protein
MGTRAAGFAAASQLKLLVALVDEAVRDPLTGCLRRESGAELLEAQLNLARRRSAPLALLFADLDRFKAVNDEFGHEVGDGVLAAAAAALREITRDSDVAIRWGGEEFVVVLPDTTSTDAVTLIKRLRASSLGTRPDGLPITVSIGVAELRADRAQSAAALVSLADHRMYLAKQAGRNRYVLDDSGEAYPIVTPEAKGE